MSAISEVERPWITDGERALHRGRVVLTERRVRLPDGSTTTYEVDESVPFAVAVLVLDGDDILLCRQYRYPLDRWIHDLPGGAGDAGESPEDAARREVEEELGIVPVDLTPLHVFSTNPGRATWLVHLFVCTSTRPGRTLTSDPAEQVRPARVPITDLDAMIHDGRIVDPAVMVARLMAAVVGILPPVPAATGVRAPASRE